MTALLGRRTLRLGPLTAAFRPRVVLAAVVALALLVVVCALNIGLGSVRIEVPDVLRALVGAGTDRDERIIFTVRLPRTLTGVLVGAAFGLAGAVFQAIARNPLASPDILGVNWGASLGAVAVIVLGGNRGQVSGTAGEIGVPVAALAGGLVAGALLYLLSWRKGVEGYRMVLVGIGISAVAMNCVYWLLTVGDVNDASRAMQWLVGNLADVGWDSVGPVALVLAVLLPLTAAAGRTHGALQFGDDTVRSLGVRLDLARTALLVIAVVLASVATAAAGPIAFIALATPQIAMRVVGASQPPLLTSALFGALLTVTADLAVRTLPGVSGLPVGVLTAVLGAPCLIFLFIRGRSEVRR